MANPTVSSGSKPLMTDSITGQAPSSRAHGGWNRGINSGLRTSFAGKDNLRKLARPKRLHDPSRNRLPSRWTSTVWLCPRQTPTSPGSAAAVHGRLGFAKCTAAMQAAKEARLDAEELQSMSLKALEVDIEEPWNDSPAKLGQSENAVSEQQSNDQSAGNTPASLGSQEANDWVFPPTPSCSDFEIGRKDQRAWEERFMAWCKSLIQLNECKIKPCRPGDKLQTSDAVSPPPKDSAPSPMTALSNGLDKESNDGSGWPAGARKMQNTARSISEDQSRRDFLPRGHYGPACGLNPQKTKEGVWEIWSQANCDRYQDQASSEMAIDFEASAGSASSERPDLGKSMVPKRHIFFEEADDDDEAEEFIRPPVQKNARTGHISFAGNRGDHSGRRPNKQYDDRNGRTGFAQPPLPPGPPPPFAATGLSSPNPEKWRSAKRGRSKILVRTWA
ncbi:hypothetical protein CHGG_00511 [Chaetomium globosum CBS 148.51]|uniref:Uncharacterized protein n=1 Tax=Chaetomium globosum (strain ATCC 6205 / CBS 148.51 / DSM 1962 / NBRC 6347 / NRRL 1970) TaxID=306901 RepID=Q2HGZ3_CHAGB|nr:uncharacterized protein CHGG_00511 [Chaetomium globosum CBS 148.51]EAQ92276.1 hypothetical protein CHGG_00511 [Chaetomium globosum CBS 148.51]